MRTFIVCTSNNAHQLKFLQLSFRINTQTWENHISSFDGANEAHRTRSVTSERFTNKHLCCRLNSEKRERERKSFFNTWLTVCIYQMYFIFSTLLLLWSWNVYIHSIDYTAFYTWYENPFSQHLLTISHVKCVYSFSFSFLFLSLEFSKICMYVCGP